MKPLCWSFLLLLISNTLGAQIIGNVTDVEGNSLNGVNVYVSDSYQGTTTNEKGDFKLDIQEKGNYEVNFQYLGFKTETKTIEVESFPLNINVQLIEEESVLDEVIIQSKENPANRIIKKAIAFRKENKAKIKAYTADFYSKGNWRVENMPDKFLGQTIDEAGDFGLDSTGNGIIYLSETQSQIKFEAPDKFHEHILASKISGDDNGFSLNSAVDAEFNFYDNTIALNADLVSPIAGFAFSYYQYKLSSAFYDQSGQLINKIEVMPKRPNDHVFSGYIYIVEDSWEIYGVELKTTGKNARIPIVKTFNFNQNFSYSTRDHLWVKRSQDISFDFKLFGVSGTGQFVGVYQNYDFNPEFNKHTFGAEVMSYAQEANKKDTTFWEKYRPVPLTELEEEDYIKKDSIAKVHERKAYKDSIDRKANQFNISDLVFGYHYQNTFKEYKFSIESPLTHLHFNTVQGWNVGTRLQFVQSRKEDKTYWRVFSDVSYGLADHRYRMTGGFETKLNNFSKPYLTIEGGVEVAEINNREALPLLLNDIANILFERNYLKLYDKKFASIRYRQELFNGFQLKAGLALERRNPLLNSTAHVIRHDSNGGYTANDPWAPDDFSSKPFEVHTIGKLQLSASYNIGQRYYTYPDGKYNDPSDKFPTLYLSYETGFASDIKAYDFHQVQFALYQKVDAKNKGDLKYGGRVGTFFGAEGMSVIDYKHFNGNQLRVNTGRELDKFNLMPYYEFSTNQDYAEAHVEHNFQGWVLGKIPGVNKLGFKLVVGGHALWSAGKKPYQEVSVGLDNLGIGLFRVLRVDYVYSFYDQRDFGAVVFGLKFLP